MLSIAQGVKQKYGKQYNLDTLNDEDWEQRFNKNIADNVKDFLICGLPKTRLSEKVLADRGDITPQEKNERKKESKEDVFVFAGYI